jgi:hypothetical protein
MLSLSLLWIAASHAQAQTLETSSHCLIKIEGKIFDAQPCDMNHDSGGAIMFGHLDEEKSAGYWVYLLDNKDGTFESFWNDEYGASRAHSKLGSLTLEERAVGECYSGDNVLLCRNIPADTPIYYVEYRDPDEGGRVLLAYLNGLEYQLVHPAWEYDAPFEVHENADFDGDGRLDFLVSVTNGGNCCPESISVISYRGDGFFTFLDDAPLPGGWGGHEVVTEQGRTLIRMHDTPSGSGNASRQRGQRDYAFSGGSMELIAERLEHSSPTEVAGLSLEDVKFAEGGQESLVFDINNDGVKDDISCSYREIWDTMNCTSKISGIGGPLELQCEHLAVSPVVFGPTGSHRLLCGGKVRPY